MGNEPTGLVDLWDIENKGGFGVSGRYEHP